MSNKVFTVGSELPSEVKAELEQRNQIMIAAATGNESLANSLFAKHIQNSFGKVKHIQNSSGAQVFGNLKDFIYYYEGLNDANQYTGIYSKYRAANGGRVNVGINDLIFSAKTRNAWGDPTFGIKVLDDNTNERMTKEDCTLVPYTAKSYRQQWRQQIQGGAEGDRMEAIETVTIGQDFKFYNGAVAGESGTQLLSYNNTHCYGLKNDPSTKQVTLSDWNTADNDTILGEMAAIVLYVKQQAFTTNASDIKLNVVDGFEGRLTAQTIGNVNRDSILTLFKKAYPSVEVEFITSELIGNAVVCWNNNRSSILYPTAMDIEVVDWKTCNPYGDEKATALSIEGQMLRHNKYGRVAACCGTLPAEAALPTLTKSTKGK